MTLHTRLDKQVAVKVLPAERTRDAKAIARFEREMKAVGKLEHPHLVRTLDAGDADGCELIRRAALGRRYATSLQKMKAHIDEPVPPLSSHRNDLSAGLDAVVERMLAKKPADRYATPAAAAEALGPFAAGHDLRQLAAAPAAPATAAPHVTVSPESATANTDAYLSSALAGTDARGL